MNYRRAATWLAFIVLVWCLVTQIIKAKEKLDSKKMTTQIRKMDSETVQGFQTCCSCTNSFLMYLLIFLVTYDSN